eukprot:Hpha_TRINITY_DN16308_c2_g1::TRINITY_DN16308_c2_g1_i8::g.58768::m.58768
MAENTAETKMLQLCDAVCTPLVKRTFSSEDTARERRIKRVCTPVAIVCWTYATLRQMIWMEDNGTVLQISLAIWQFTFSVYLIAVFSKQRQVVWAIEFALSFNVVGFLMLDIESASMLTLRLWSLVVPTLDVNLVADVTLTVPFTLGLTVAYLLTESAESTARFGLYELVQPASPPPICQCAAPPCAVSTGSAVGAFSFSMMVMLFDFFITRGFARDLKRQVQSMAVTLKAAEDVTAALARYDVEKAMDGVRADLPERLQESFRHLIENSRRYRAFLPEDLYVDSARNVEPAANVAESAFTSDGNSSTSSWGKPKGSLGGRHAELITGHHAVHMQDGDVDAVSVVSDLSEPRLSESRNSMGRRGPPRLGLKSVQRTCVFLSINSSDIFSEGARTSTLNEALYVLLSTCLDAIFKARGQVVQFDAQVVQCLFLKPLAGTTAAVGAVEAMDQTGVSMDYKPTGAVTAGSVFVGAVGSHARRTLVVHGKPMDVAACAANMFARPDHVTIRASKKVLSILDKEAVLSETEGGWKYSPQLQLCWIALERDDHLAADVTPFDTLEGPTPPEEEGPRAAAAAIPSPLSPCGVVP